MLLHHGHEPLLSAKPDAKFLLDLILQLLPLLVILFHEPLLRFKGYASGTLFILILDARHESIGG